MATQTHPAQWLDTPDDLIATTLDVLREQARRRKGR